MKPITATRLVPSPEEAELWARALSLEVAARKRARRTYSLAGVARELLNAWARRVIAEHEAAELEPGHLLERAG